MHDNICKLNLADNNYQFLYDAAVRSVLLHSPKEVYPGPFTYKRFWFRDAAFIIYAMLRVGMNERAEKLIDNFFEKQTAFGYFHSQQGEWDSNGQVLWLMNQYCRLTGKKAPEQWLKPVVDAAKWIGNKRTSKDPQKPHSGLLPAGFSAEHFGPIDYYYWDDFWAVAGLKAAAEILEQTQYESKSAEFRSEADDFLGSIEGSLRLCQKRLKRPAMPASPYRRLDSGAVGCLAASYPLEIFSADDERVSDTADFLMHSFMVNNGFFHDISHSGINPYLTLHMAELLMRNEDLRFMNLVKGVADLASETGQWPEAINPRTGSGCMGDGQHIWASAEWIIMAVNSFVMEQDDKLILGAGVFPDWLQKNNRISMGPIMTTHGPVTVAFENEKETIKIHWKANWRLTKPEIIIRLPGYKPVTADADETYVTLKRMIKV